MEVEKVGLVSIVASSSHFKDRRSLLKTETVVSGTSPNDRGVIILQFQYYQRTRSKGTNNFLSCQIFFNRQ